MFDLVYSGIISTPAYATESQRRDSPLTSAMNSPITTLSGLGLSSRRGSFRTSTTAHNTPTHSSRPTRTSATSPQSALSPRLFPSLVPQTATPRWARPLMSISSMLEMIWQKTFLSEDLVERNMVFCCFCLGQDDADSCGEEVEERVLNAVRVMLSPVGGRRGELALRKILEGKLEARASDKGFKTLSLGRKVARGAVK